MAAVLDIVHAFVEVAWIPTVTFWNIVIGIGSALVAALFGLLDWSKIPEGTRAKRGGALHALGNVVALVLFTGSVVLRSREQPPGALLPLLMEVLALVLLGVTAWLGGELVQSKLAVRAAGLRDQAGESIAHVGHEAGELGHRAYRGIEWVGSRAIDVSERSPLTRGLVALAAGALVTMLLSPARRETRGGRTHEAAA